MSRSPAGPVLLGVLLAVGCSTSAPTDYTAKPAPPEVARAQVARMIGKAQGALQRDQPGEAILYLDDALHIEPENRDALFLAGRARLQRGLELEGSRHDEAHVHVVKALTAFETLRTRYPDLQPIEKSMLATARFLDARLLDLLGDPTKALASLKRAADEGFAVPDALKQPGAFASIKDAPEFQEIAQLVSKHARDEARALVKTILGSNKPFPFDFRLNDLDGKPVSLGDFRGRVVLVDIWGTWCGPCRVELPHLVDLHKRQHENGLEIIGLNAEQQAAGPEQAAELVRRAVAEFQLPYTCLLVEEDVLLQVPEFRSFPTKVVIDRSGTVRAKLEGVQPLEVLEAIVTSLLAEPATGPATTP